MPHARRFWYRSLVAAGLLLLLGAGLAAPAHAQPPPPTAQTTPPPASAGNGFGNLAARWFTWALSQPATVDVNGTNTFPILDSTGAYATVGQENGIGPANKYFFLAGNFGGTTTRTVTVPRGKTLFFPIITSQKDNAVPHPPNEPPANFKVPELKQQAKAEVDTATKLSAQFDGKEIGISRAATPVFDYTVPENSIYDFFKLVGPQFEGRIKPAVGDGYWASIPPPTPGYHELHFHSENPPANPGDDPFVLDVTYKLTVT